MSIKHRPFKNEKEMSERVFLKLGSPFNGNEFTRKYTAREVFVRVDGEIDPSFQFDVIHYDTDTKTFKGLECKAGHHRATLRRAFRQIARYRRGLEKRSFAFLESFTRKSPMRFGRMMEATSGGKQIQVEFYVALTDEACSENVELLGKLKERHPDTGIIRVKDDGRLKHYIKAADGRRDYEIAKARPVSFRIEWPAPDRMQGEERR